MSILRPTTWLGLRGRLLVLLVLCSLPAIGVLAYQAVPAQREAIEESTGLVRSQARKIGVHLRETLKETETLLKLLATQVDRAGGASASCHGTLSRLLRSHGAVSSVQANFAIVGADGELICEGQPFLGRLNVSDRPYFRHAIRSGSFTVGDLVLARRSGRTLIPLILPWHDRDGRPDFAVMTGIEVGALAKRLIGTLGDVEDKKPRLVISVFDGGGNVVVRSPERESLVGQKTADSDLFRSFAEHSARLAEQPSKSAGLDGVVRYYSHVHLDVANNRFVVSVGQDAQAVIMNARTSFLLNAASSGLLFLLAMSVAGVYGGTSIIRPIRHLTRVAARMTAGDFTCRASFRSNDEIGALGRAFNDLANSIQSYEARMKRANRALEQELHDRRAAEAALVHVQKMEAIGHLTGGIAHDFNNLLTAILGNLQLVKRSLQGDDRNRQRLQTAEQAALRGRDLTRSLLNFAGRGSFDPMTLDLNQVIRTNEDLIRNTTGESIRLELELDDDLWPVDADLSVLESTILNLVINACDAMPYGGRLTIKTANNRFDRGHDPFGPLETGQDCVDLTIRDTGIGMTPETKARAFEPFFTTKGPGHGTGLGLSMVYGFAKQCGGSVTIDSEIGAGTTVILCFPRANLAGAENPDHCRDSLDFAGTAS